MSSSERNQECWSLKGNRDGKPEWRQGQKRPKMEKGPFKDSLSIKGSPSAKDQGKRETALPPHLQPAAATTLEPA